MQSKTLTRNQLLARSRRFCGTTGWPSVEITQVHLLRHSSLWRSRYWLNFGPGIVPSDRGFCRLLPCSRDCSYMEPYNICADVTARENLITSAVDPANVTISPPGYRTIMAKKQPQDYWLDISQVSLNPWVRRVLSSQQWRVEDGRLDALLTPYHWIYSPRCEDPNGLWRSMFISYPPYQTLSLCYMDFDRRGPLRLMTTLHDPNGIKVGAFLDALKLYAPRLVEKWLQIKRNNQASFQPDDPNWRCELTWQFQGPEIAIVFGALPE